MRILRSLVVYLYALMTMVILLPLRIYYNSRPPEKLDETQAKVHRLVRSYAYSLNAVIGLKVRVIGEENVPEEGPVLFVGNHQSFLDIPVIVEASPLGAGFLAKEELGKIPLLGGWIRVVASAFLTREDDRQALQVILDLARRFQAYKHSMIVFPEGTRTEDGSVGEFKAGAFRIATRAEAKVVPFALRGSDRAMPRGAFLFRPGPVDVVFFPAIPTHKKTDTILLAETCEGFCRDFVEKGILPPGMAFTEEMPVEDLPTGEGLAEGDTEGDKSQGEEAL